MHEPTSEQGTKMEPYYQNETVTLYSGDNREVLKTLPDNSVDACITDPPYELGFMGRKWDSSGIAYDVELWGEVLRVLKPGGHLLAFGGTRTWHRIAVAIEDAGFEVRDSIAWMYGSGFPKSLDVSKAIDKRGGTSAEFAQFRNDVKLAMERNNVTRSDLQQALGNFMLSHYLTAGSQPAVPNLRDYLIIRDTVRLGDKWDTHFNAEAEREVVGKYDTDMGGLGGQRLGTAGGDITAPATDAAKQWQGWGTALKPAFEPIVVARKPLIGTVAENVLAHGTGALNIDASRIGTQEMLKTQGAGTGVVVGKSDSMAGPHYERVEVGTVTGRWPANVILDESQAAELDKQSGVTSSRKGEPRGTVKKGMFANSEFNAVGAEYDDQGGASRFFYCAKAPKKERPNVDGIAHPTVKPLTLMRYLARLITPPGGTILEPFAGSGTTIEAATIENFNCIAIELTPEYLPLIMQRITKNTETTLL